MLPVEVILTVSAVMAPVLAAGPSALTQSPRARSVAAALCVALTVVDFDVVMVKVCVLGVGGFFDFEPDVLVPRGNWPRLTLKPETVSVDPLTDFTLPDAMASEPSALRKFDDPLPELRDGNERPPSPPPPAKFGPPLPLPPWNWKPPLGAPPGAPLVRVPKVVHDPLELAVDTLIERAAMVVLDFFDGVPVTLTQSPAANPLTASVIVLENCVVDVQFTVVWPVVAFCTSMLEALSAATLPLALAGGLAGGVGGGIRGRAEGRRGDQGGGAGADDADPAVTPLAVTGR